MYMDMLLVEKISWIHEYGLSDVRPSGTFWRECCVGDLWSSESPFINMD